MINSDSTRRSIRTGIDNILAVLGALGAVFLVPGIEDVFREIGLGGKLSLFSGIVLVLVVFFTKLKNGLEDAGKIPAILKAPASSGENPVPDPEPEAVDEMEPDDQVYDDADESDMDLIEDEALALSPDDEENYDEVLPRRDDLNHNG